MSCTYGRFMCQYIYYLFPVLILPLVPSLVDTSLTLTQVLRSGMAEDKRRLYRGSCQCGFFVYETQMPEITSVYYCNCSLCVKKGYLWIFPGQKNIKILRGNEDKLTSYKFGPKKLSHKVRR